ncbi:MULTISPECIES: aldehyde dehydrogenase (NADP(+)) [Sphingobium]|jgi:2,5-dioxopentanoate dehydrogenase|uniref:aldehyde dehydrogenase (NADP(+)) n=1 Tax=Sphingobium TaxID=165695 RepID=UPI000C41ECEF|nr:MULTISPECIES: aldehyde dehydrogenase (NADP(+)) [Sphingobium]MAP44127.1 aldehyde dehydrogenase (NADP(+)) [Sphingobium sp.]MBA37321.1 aldehyde dehydrogenase (NADP(+)) [Sphingobium sp.]MBA38669.1 aldehyde dehydrogenase (NADP(+)) [Sphingobium sp.]MBS47956.1 aldehyde dehydrogenase (NADP(+)) [Sphingobium sp.]MCC4255572.1 aldehyde dehydrogenase (NADP(+)) [Sphingobium lactosutens]
MFNGAILIGASERTGGQPFHAINPATGEKGDVAFSSAMPADVEQATKLADEAFESFSTLSPDARATFLESVADNIMGIGDLLIETAMAESGLPRARLEGERGRTVGQLRLFASYVRLGDWLDATIDRAMPERAPLPRADLRRVNHSVGPVAVFGASNFPLAFSVAGGDTAAAFAAGSPVVVKGHSAHPGTGELVARAIQAAVKSCGLHEGVFSYLPGADRALGGALVADPRIKAVGFTGSRGGGTALMKIAAERPEPIPVYAEMSSINPVVLLPGALASRGEAMGAAFVGSLTMGSGQFCTNPGLVIALDGPDLDTFVASAAAAMSGAAPQVMLTPGIHEAYEKGVAALASADGVTTVARGTEPEGVNRGQAAFFSTDSATFTSNPVLAEEVFGSSSVLIRCSSIDEVVATIAGLEGQLTATLQIGEGDQDHAAKLLPTLSRKVGRILTNGWPTGVEVTHAMVHGGPFPSTADGRSTSVGTLAMMRFLRPVCYQDVPDTLLPAALQDANPWGLTRRVEGKLEVAA